MSSPAKDEAEQLQELVQQLAAAAKDYVPSSGPQNYIDRSNITRKAKEIMRLMMAPSDMPLYHTVNMIEVVAIRTLRGLGVFEKIPVEGSISLADLSKATNVQDSLLERMLRLLVGVGFVDQTADYKYGHTKFSKAYTFPVPGPGNHFQMLFDENFSTMWNFHNYVKEVAGGGMPSEPDDSQNNPYTHRHGMDGRPVWDVLANLPDRLKAFQLGFMAQEDSGPIIGFFDYAALFDPATDGDRPTLVDVGGGQGQSIMQILQATPSLDPSRMVLQDLPEPVQQAQESKMLPEGVRIMVHDFWTPQPIKGAKAYFIRRIMHDYSDENCTKILRQIRDAMSPDSKVLIADMVMPKRVSEADLPAAAMDNCMMVMGGKERTEENFSKILSNAGLKLSKVWRSREGGATGNLVEARLMD
ncbi:uncharacterized protein Z518_00560 [Rhinocladiella mackenziei CBS 650.93]|uniref:O-methyltransferase domain-containing protein n=1 Tax=Rhinocladiella mackenziei CBS 650.93 TaxID=1442369 RepID=A0A0D2JJA3_9EURO|nr:uncharacterized protein Z518_00560 [Rhinocladiella mackenziei CBS 650.93]KIX09480.1 hypothetical protein Z518_00560 [Rhinocladiella mackenziei CBS 650.93]